MSDLIPLIGIVILGVTLVLQQNQISQLRRTLLKLDIDLSQALTLQSNFNGAVKDTLKELAKP